MEFKGVKQDKAKVNLFFNWYENESRQHEINKCLRINKKLFDNVIIVDGRPTFQELFELTKSYPNDINCFCNSDIHFIDLTLLHTIKPNECYALTRDDLRFTQHAKGSQDAWIFRGEIKEIKARLTTGKWGCDNHLAWLIQNAGYGMSNPCLSIEIKHLHAVDDRQHSREENNTVPAPYLLIPPTKL